MSHSSTKHPAHPALVRDLRSAETTVAQRTHRITPSWPPLGSCLDTSSQYPPFLLSPGTGIHPTGHTRWTVTQTASVPSTASPVRGSWYSLLECCNHFCKYLKYQGFQSLWGWMITHWSTTSHCLHQERTPALPSVSSSKPWRRRQCNNN